MNILIRLSVFFLISASNVFEVVAWSPGFLYRPECGLLITGGSGYRYVNPTYGGKEISIQTIRNGTSEVVYSQENPFGDVQLSLSCRWISFYRYAQDGSKDAVQIIDRSGRVVRTLTGARYTAWGSDSSGADWIAYIVCENSEEEGFRSRGTWVLNVATGEQHEVYPGGQEVTWGGFEQSFFIGNLPNDVPQDREVQRYNLESRKLEATKFHGVDFSPDGTYYYTRSYEGSELCIFLSETNLNISSRYASMLKLCFNGNPSFWLNKSMIVFYSERIKKRGNRVIDFDRSEAWEVREEVIGYDDKAESPLLVLIDGKVVARKFGDAAKLIYPVPNAEAGKATPTETKVE